MGKVNEVCTELTELRQEISEDVLYRNRGARQRCMRPVPTCCVLPDCIIGVGEWKCWRPPMFRSAVECGEDPRPTFPIQLDH